MGISRLIVPSGSIVNKRKLRIVLIIAICWTLADFIIFLIKLSADSFSFKYEEHESITFRAILLREANVFIVSLIIGFLLISLRRFLRHTSPWFHFLIKTIILILAGLIMSFFIYITYELVIGHRTFNESIHRFVTNTFQPGWIIPKMAEWGGLYILTQLAIEVNEKYSPGVFVDIMMGRYLQPKEENRIIIFVDLRNSTPIAEKLANIDYFEFIRDFIFCISAGLMEHDARIYQYVGDEIVAWWPSSKENSRKAVDSLIESRKILNTNTDVFMRNYDIVPEYKAGIHVGPVTVGQVGISKKELVMSGNTINTASRIRSACTDLNQKFLVSKDLIDLLEMKDWQSESMGEADLKGKNENIELFALKI
ncbi:MAG TPA: adenylate/guanylate cyclase domain-containing protein [Chitinophagaceae bacterium]